MSCFNKEAKERNREKKGREERRKTSSKTSGRCIRVLTLFESELEKTQNTKVVALSILLNLDILFVSFGAVW